MGLFDIFKNKQKLIDRKNNHQDLPNKDELKTHLDSIQKEIYQFLKPMGFKKKGRTFNKQTEDGIYQVINIQSGRYEFGDKNIISGLRENYYGKFTINLGVLVKEVYEVEEYNKPKEFYQEYDCQIRTRLSQLTRNQDIWWQISENKEKNIKEIIEKLTSGAFEWFEKLSDRKNICKNIELVENIHTRRAKLDIAIIKSKLDKKIGEKLFQEYYDNIKNNQGHKEYVISLSEKLGLKINDY